MERSENRHPSFERFQWAFLILGIAGLAASAVGAFVNRQQFFQSYLFGYLFWLGIALGCFGVTLIHYLTGGSWSMAVRRPLESGATTLPLLALLFLPLLFGLSELYLWARPEVVAADPLLQQKSAYLNVPFFLIRAAIYFAIWLVITFILWRWSRQPERPLSPGLQLQRRYLSAVGLVLFGLTITFAYIDWIMSLEPHWFSTIYSLMVIAGDALAAFGLVIAVAILIADYLPISELLTPRVLNDLGSLLLSFLLMWAYFAFSQFMLIWFGNVPEEVVWYVHRIEGGWQWLVWLIVIFHFALPFLALLSRSLKRSARALALTGLLIAGIHLVDKFWLVVPAFYPAALRIHWLDLAVLIGLGGLWLAGFVWQLGQAVTHRRTRGAT